MPHGIPLHRRFLARLVGYLLAVSWLAAMNASHAAQSHDSHAGHHHPKPSAVTRSVSEMTVPDLPFVRGDGRATTLREELGDGPVFVNFIFTTCTSVCPVMSQIFADTHARLRTGGQQVRLVSISIDPLQDTPDRLATYAKRFAAGAAWRFLTGSLESSIAAQKAFRTYTGDKMNHPVATFFRARADQPWVRLDGFATPNDLLRELARKH